MAIPKPQPPPPTPLKICGSTTVVLPAPTIWSPSLPVGTTTDSKYVPAASVIRSPGPAFVTAAAIVVSQPTVPVGFTQNVAAEAGLAAATSAVSPAATAHRLRLVP